MKSTWFSRKEHHLFAKCLEDAARGSRSMWETFSDWLELAYLSLSQAAHKFRTGSPDEAKEADYRRIITRYQHPEKFPEAFAIVVNALETDLHDFIGTVAESLELTNDWHGQFFTPSAVCDLMARMQLGELKPDREKRLRICEPCVGGGAIAIATVKYLKECGFLPWHYWMECMDIDLRMYQSAYIQLTLCGAPAMLRWGNSLSSEPWRRAEPTLIAAMHPYRFTAAEIAEMEQRETEQEQADAEAFLRQSAPVTDRPQQLTFDFTLDHAHPPTNAQAA